MKLFLMVVYCKDLDLVVPDLMFLVPMLSATNDFSPDTVTSSGAGQPRPPPPDWQTQESWSHSCWHSEHFKPSHIPILFSRGQKCHSSLIEVVKCPADSLPVWSVIQDILNDICKTSANFPIHQQQSTCMITIIQCQMSKQVQYCWSGVKISV